MAYKPTGRPRGRPSILGRPMTPAERMQRSRWLRTMANQWFGRRRDKYEEQQRWLRIGEAKYVAWQLAALYFDYRTHTANFARWNEINEHVLDRLVLLELEFAGFRNKKAQPPSPGDAIAARRQLIQRIP